MKTVEKSQCAPCQLLLLLIPFSSSSLIACAYTWQSSARQVWWGGSIWTPANIKAHCSLRQCQEDWWLPFAPQQFWNATKSVAIFPLQDLQFLGPVNHQCQRFVLIPWFISRLVWIKFTTQWLSHCQIYMESRPGWSWESLRWNFAPWGIFIDDILLLCHKKMRCFFVVIH